MKKVEENNKELKNLIIEMGLFMVEAVGDVISPLAASYCKHKYSQKEQG